MLNNVHVKNLALIDSADIFFSEGLNILSGETGAGKTILLGAIHLALGGKFQKDMLRSGCSDALAELTFSIENKAQKEALEALDIALTDALVLTRKIKDGRSIARINGEAASTEKLKAAADILLDLHTQSEHQTLLQKGRQLELVDQFAGEAAKTLKTELSESYRRYMQLMRQLEAFQTDESARQREMSLLTYEIEEIDAAALQPGEDEELERLYQRLQHAREITEGLQAVHQCSGYEDGAGSLIGRACGMFGPLVQYDETLADLAQQLEQIDALLNDFNRECADYMDGFEFDDAVFAETENRLNLCNHIKMKYGKTLEAVFEYRAQQEARLAQLSDYETTLRNMEEEIAAQKQQYDRRCDAMRRLRKKSAEAFRQRVYEELIDLNFLQVRFEIKLGETKPTASGKDQVEFLLSFNPGEALRPLERVASGGELSRFMLAVKTVLADAGPDKSLLFDEIDAGISGITAQKVSQKLAKISGMHQVICITHLPQIAAMADRHFKIEKHAVDDETISGIEELDAKGAVAELARMLSGAEQTEAVMKNAEELKAGADQMKQKLRKK